MKDEIKLECESRTDYVAGKDIDTGLLMKFIYVQQRYDWEGFASESIARGASEDLAYGFANGMLHMLDELIEFLVREGALVEVSSSEA